MRTVFKIVRLSTGGLRGQEPEGHDGLLPAPPPPLPRAGIRGLPRELRRLFRQR